MGYVDVYGHVAGNDVAVQLVARCYIQNGAETVEESERENKAIKFQECPAVDCLKPKAMLNLEEAWGHEAIKKKNLYQCK